MQIIDTSWNWNGAITKRATTKYIFLHHSASTKCTAKDIHHWHQQRGWVGIGYHFVIDKEGNIYRGRPLDSVGAHITGYNSYSVGVCAVGDYSKETVMPKKQLRAIADLLNYLKKIYPTAQIMGHKEKGSTACPGKYYPLNELKNYKNIVQVGDDKPMKTDIRYHYIKDLPEAYKPTIEKLYNAGIIKGRQGEDLDLSEDMCRLLVYLDRAKIFG